MYLENVKPLTFQVGAAIAQYVFVTFNSSGVIVPAAAGADAIGVTLEAVTAAEFTAGKRAVPVAMIQSGGKCPVRAVASTAIAVGDIISSAANGEAAPTATTRARLGVAVEVAGNDADQELVVIIFDKGARLTP